MPANRPRAGGAYKHFDEAAVGVKSVDGPFFVVVIFEMVDEVTPLAARERVGRDRRRRQQDADGNQGRKQASRDDSEQCGHFHLPTGQAGPCSPTVSQ